MLALSTPVNLFLVFLSKKFYLDGLVKLIFKKKKEIENKELKKNIFFFLKEKAKTKSSINLKEKKELLNMISESIGRKITSVNIIFLSQKMRFGNQIILINLAIFFCEILGCKKIILDKNWNWFIKNKIIYKKYRMIIDVLRNKRL